MKYRMAITIGLAVFVVASSILTPVVKGDNRARKIYTVRNGVVTKRLLRGRIPSDGYVTRYLKVDRKIRKYLVTIIIPANSKEGYILEALRKGDEVEFITGSGEAAFDMPDGPLADSLGQLVKTVPIPDYLLNAIGSEADEIAKELFGNRVLKGKKRDVYGADPDTGTLARQEGGILISLPGDDLYLKKEFSPSGKDKNRWIKEPGDRIDGNRPDHIKHGFFPIKNGNNKRVVEQDGNLQVVAWDYKYNDNAGVYKVILVLRLAQS